MLVSLGQSEPSRNCCQASGIGRKLTCNVVQPISAVQIPSTDWSCHNVSSYLTVQQDKNNSKFIPFIKNVQLVVASTWKYRWFLYTGRC